MILLDTNVISEAIRPAPDPAVRSWLDTQAAETLFISSVTVAEMAFGIGALPAGRRKQALSAALEAVRALFAGRVLAFDEAAALRYGDLAVRGVPTPDGYIAAIAAVRGFAVATRDGSAFAAAGVAVIDPWRAESN